MLHLGPQHGYGVRLAVDETFDFERVVACCAEFDGDGVVAGVTPFWSAGVNALSKVVATVLLLTLLCCETVLYDEVDDEFEDEDE